MPTLHVLRGIPASGKSTYAKQWLMEDPQNRVRINRDDIREAITGSAANHSQEKRVSQLEVELTERALRAGKDVMSDNTNTNTKYLPKTVAMAKRLGADVTHKDFPITINEALKRNAARDRKVPEEVIRRMYGNLGPQGQFPVFPGSYPTKPIVLPAAKKTAVLFDMDGTLNDVRGVRHFLTDSPKRKDFDSFHRMSEFEPAIDDVMDIMKDAHEQGFAIIITTARSEEYRETTQKWLDDHNVPYENIFMRPAGDSRADYEIKKEMFDKISPYYDIVRGIDDNFQAIRAWKEKGLAVTAVPFQPELNSGPVRVENIFRTGNCVRCGKPFKGVGPLGPTCRLKA
jgi:predicted kinase